MSTTPFAFTQLLEPAANTYTTPPANFDPNMAAQLAQFCNLAYEQLQGSIDIAAYLPPGFKIVANFTVPEGITLDSGAAGYYVSVPAGFAASDGNINVIAIRGSQTIPEWMDDADVIPTAWVEGDNNGPGFLPYQFAPYGLVHSGIYDYYNLGYQGAIPQLTYYPPSSENYGNYFYTRPSGSLAQQILELGQNGNFNATLPLYVTGHSLGAAIAALCAMDIATNQDLNVAPAGNIHFYGLACPNVAVGISPDSPVLQTALSAIGLTFPASLFVTSFNAAVTDSWLIANACDLIPILPPPTTNLGGQVTVQFLPVTSNIISFCSQAGTILGNHSCSNTYLPYLQALAGGFPTLKALAAAS